jgi:dCTP deaminase
LGEETEKETRPMAPAPSPLRAADGDPSLFPEAAADDTSPAARHSTGILPAQALRQMIRAGEIAAASPILEPLIQPASLDLRLGRRGWRVRASFLPGPENSVQAMIDELGMHEIDLARGAVLERGCVYIVPLQEHLKLGYRVTGFANPKSTSGRLDVFTRLIVDHADAFDRVGDGYAGPLYAEIAPRTFSVLVREGDTLNQLRIRRGSPRTSDSSLKRLQEEVTLVHGRDDGADIDHGIAVSVDLAGEGQGALIGYRARRHTGLIDLGKVDHYDPLDFWEPLHRRGPARLVLDPDDFYILASREAVTVPPDHAAEMQPFNPLVGEFRVHYAGFFDPGFGHAGAGGQGARAVLEIRSREVPFVLEHGQTVARLIYERLTAEPDKVYGPSIGSNYQRQGLKLSKHFRRAG